jgi:hypothetical protein
LKLEDLSPVEIRQQIALYIEAAAVRPLLSSGVPFDQLAETFVALAVTTMQENQGRLAAALMLQRATRHTFAGAGCPERQGDLARRR